MFCAFLLDKVAQYDIHKHLVYNTLIRSTICLQVITVFITTKLSKKAQNIYIMAKMICNDLYIFSLHLTLAKN